MDGYSTYYYLDRTLHGGGILIYIREDISSRMIKLEPLPNCFEGFFVEITLRQKKELLSCSYNPNKNNIANHVEHAGTEHDQLRATDDNLILIEDI